MKWMRKEINTFGELQKAAKGNKIIVFGCGGHARSIISVIWESDKETEIILVDGNAGEEEYILGCKVMREFKIRDNDRYIIAIGDNLKRRQIYSQMKSGHAGYCILLVSLYANIGMDAQIGMGTFVAPNVYVGSQAIIGDNTILNTGSIVEHEAIIGNHTHIAPGAIICGRTRIGNNVFCGAGSTIIDKITICDNVTIGAGAVVKENILVAGTYVGVPAKRVK